MHSRAARRGPHLGRGHGRAVHHHPYARGRRPAPAADTVQVKGSGTASFTGLTYTAPGDYRYTVRQCAGGTAHMTYDATVYTVTVRVTNRPNGGLGAEIWATGGSSEKTGLLLFQNRYDPPAAPTPTPAPAKTTPWPRAPRAQVRPAQVRPAPNRRPHAGDPAGRAGRALCRWANGSIL